MRSTVGIPVARGGEDVNGRDGELARIAAPEFDRELNVNEAVALGRKRAAQAHKAQNTHKARVTRANQSAAPAINPNTPPADATEIPHPAKRLSGGA